MARKSKRSANLKMVLAAGMVVAISAISSSSTKAALKTGVTTATNNPSTKNFFRTGWHKFKSLFTSNRSNSKIINNSNLEKKSKGPINPYAFYFGNNKQEVKLKIDTEENKNNPYGTYLGSDKSVTSPFKQKHIVNDDGSITTVLKGSTLKSSSRRKNLDDGKIDVSPNKPHSPQKTEGGKHKVVAQVHVGNNDYDPEIDEAVYYAKFDFDDIQRKLDIYGNVKRKKSEKTKGNSDKINIKQLGEINKGFLDDGNESNVIYAKVKKNPDINKEDIYARVKKTKKGDPSKHSSRLDIKDFSKTTSGVKNITGSYKTVYDDIKDSDSTGADSPPPLPPRPVEDTNKNNKRLVSKLKIAIKNDGTFVE